MKILFIWELGANFGHLARQRPVARILRQNGHEVTFVVPDTAAAEKLLGPSGFRIVQVPTAPAITRKPWPPASYGEVLLGAGFDDPKALVARVRAWRNLFEVMEAEALLLDHAPTALLAARIADLPRTVVGNGFTIPPSQSPYPCFRIWETVSSKRLGVSEQQALVNINAVRHVHGQRPQTAVGELFEGATKALTMLPEIDHYGARSGERYLGPIFGDIVSDRTEWPEGSGKRVLAYLRPDAPGFLAMVEVFKNLAGPVVLIAPGVSDGWSAQHSNYRFSIHNAPVDLEPLLAGCDLGVSYGGSGTMSQFLLAGIPQIVLPKNAEQYLVGMRIQAAQSGLLIGKVRDGPTLARAVSEALADPAYRTASHAIAKKYRGFRPLNAAQDVVSLLMAAISAS